MLNRIICMNSFPTNKVWRDYFLRASVSCVISFRKNLFFCGALLLGQERFAMFFLFRSIDC